MSLAQNPSAPPERRKHPRIDTSNDVEYILLDQNRERVDKGEGQALNLSQSGAMLETKKPLNGAFIILITIDLEGKQVQVKGKVAYTRESDRPGFHVTGIRFTGSRKEHVNAIVAFVKTYYRRKYSRQNGDDPQQADSSG
ncbi:MAG: PilZ domain-containing protein [Desulfobacterales bacterium]|nr:PilZ domain-containing protein [Desulfobacterales bacterium]